MSLEARCGGERVRSSLKEGEVDADLDLLSVLVKLPLHDDLDAIGSDRLGGGGKSLCRRRVTERRSRSASERRTRRRGKGRVVRRRENSAEPKRAVRKRGTYQTPQHRPPSWSSLCCEREQSRKRMQEGQTKSCRADEEGRKGLNGRFADRHLYLEIRAFSSASR